MELANIVIRGAREHNLQNIDLELPRNQLIVFTGVSGSGKSSLVIDTLLPALQQRLHHSKAQPGEHDNIEGLHHVDRVIDIDQSPIGRTPRSNFPARSCAGGRSRS